MLAPHGRVLANLRIAGTSAFSFTLVLAASSAFACPRKKFLTVIAVTRLVRFTLVGLLAVFFGWGSFALLVFPIMKWIKRR